MGSAKSKRSQTEETDTDDETPLEDNIELGAGLYLDDLESVWERLSFEVDQA